MPLQRQGALDEYYEGEQFLDSEDRHKAACLIADIRMPGMSGIELQAKLKAERCRIPIIFITGRGDIPLAVCAMKEGASDFFTKPVDVGALLGSVERALQQDRAIRREEIDYARLVARYECLTTRERELLPLLVSGLLNKQVAFELGITEYTVQFHRGHITRKMEAASFADLVRMADKVSANHQQHHRCRIRDPCLAAHRTWYCFLPSTPSASELWSEQCAPLSIGAAGPRRWLVLASGNISQPIINAVVVTWPISLSAVSGAPADRHSKI